MLESGEEQMLIDRSDFMPVYHQVKQLIRRQVRDKKLQPGEQIGSVAKMARLFHISTATVVKATTELINEGVLYSKVGRGTFVADPAGKKTRTICFVIHSSSYITLPYFSQIVAGIGEVADTEHYKLQFITSARVARTIDGDSPYPALKENKWADGLIIMDALLDDKKVLTLAEKLPVVLIDRKIEGADVACVRADDREGTYRAISHLASLGHSRIGVLVMSRMWQTDREKVRGYRSAVADLGLESDPDLIVDFGPERDNRSSSSSLEALLNVAKPPTAIFVGDDMSALVIIQLLREGGVRVPEDIAVVGFDGCLRDVIPPKMLTTMGLPIVKMGEVAANMLLDLINKEEIANREIVFSPTLAVGQSCGGRRQGKPRLTLKTGSQASQNEDVK